MTTEKVKEDFVKAFTDIGMDGYNRGLRNGFKAVIEGLGAIRLLRGDAPMSISDLIKIVESQLSISEKAVGG